MKKSASRIVGLVMLIIAVAFIMFAVNHPEMSFPWNNTITWLLYGLYVLVTVVLLIAPKMKKETIPVCRTRSQQGLGQARPNKSTSETHKR